MTQLEVVRMLRNELGGDSSQARLASAIGISPQYLCDILAYKREPARKVLQHLGLVKQVDYVRKATAKKGGKP